MADLAHLTAMDGGNAGGLQEQSLPCCNGPDAVVYSLAEAVNSFAEHWSHS